MSNIAIIVPTLHAISETFITNQIEHLAPGRTVVIADKANSQPPYSFPVLTLEGLVSESGIIRRMDQAFTRRLRRLPGYHCSRTFLLRRAVQSFLRSNEVEIVLAQYGPTGCWMAEVCRSMGARLYVHFHGQDASSFVRIAGYRAAYAKNLPLATALICPSEYLRQQLIEIGLNGERIHVQPYGVDISRFSAKRRANSNLCLLFVGRFVEKKGPLQLLRSFAIAAEARRDLKLEMIGTGPLFENSIQLAGELGISDIVTFHGPKDHSDVVKMMHCSYAYVQHSVIAQDGETEGVPNSVLEAMSAGLPIISTMHPGIMDIVENGKNGLLSAEHDVDAMARNILAMTADPDRAFIMGQAGRGMIHQHYSLAAQMCGLRTIMNKSSFWPNPTSPSGCATGHGPISDGP